MTPLVRSVQKSATRMVAQSLGKRRYPFASRGPTHIAYWIAGGIGDGIMAFPALHFLRKHFPSATIDVFAPPQHSALFSRLIHPFIVFPYVPAIILKRALRHSGYSLSFSNTIGAFRLAGETVSRFCSAYTAGFRYPDEPPRDRMYDFSLPLTETDHDIDQNLALIAETTGIPIEGPDRCYPTGSHTNANDSPQRVLIHPGAGKGYSAKEWPVTRYCELIGRLKGRKCKVTVMLGPAEIRHYREFSAIKDITIRHSHDTATFIDCITSSTLFIGNDSGPSHCASLYGVPTITLFGPSSIVRNLPRGPNAKAVSAGLPCAPCHFKKEPCANPACMTSITVDQVWKAVEEIMGGTPKW